jgi:hypothetical protein
MYFKSYLNFLPIIKGRKKLKLDKGKDKGEKKIK